MALTGKQINYLRGLAHSKGVSVSVGNAGPTGAVADEISAALAKHELVKVKLPALSKTERLEMLDSLCSQTSSERVQHIGRVGVLYREAEKPRISLPK